MKKFLPVLSIIFCFTLIFYLPILIDPKLFVGRPNDLTEFFWPLIYFIRENLLKIHQLPFWNNLFFSGTPLLPDPQSQIFYLPNLIFMIFKNIDTGFILSTFMHIYIAGVGMYFLSKNAFRFSTITSLFCSFIYIASPKLAGYIEAGHFGLITSWTWLPFAFLFTLLLAKKPTLKKTALLSISLALIFYTHVLIFAITVISITLLYIYLILKNKKIANIKFLIPVGIFCFGLVAIAFLPQLAWQNQTTRSLLLQDPDVYPKWLSLTEFIKASISPLIFGHKFIWELDTEKLIGIGLFTSTLGVYGFLNLKRKTKIIIIVVLSIIILISLNNISPIHSLLIKQNWYILLRVSTRFWYLLLFILIFLAGHGLENLTRFKTLIIIITLTELLVTSWTILLKPIMENSNFASEEVYKFLHQDASQFRVFCLNRCLSQKASAIYGLELADGYGTLQQKNYYDYSQQLAQSFWRNRYTLSIPPFEIFNFENLQPYSPNLSIFNIKYVISNHFLQDKNLKLVKQVNQYLIYENKINNPRSNYPITLYTPNRIQIDTTNYIGKQLILSEVYNQDWHAYLNGVEKTKIQEMPDKIRQVEIPDDTKFVDFIYEPDSFKSGSIITLATLMLITILLFSFKDTHIFQDEKKNTQH